jgi:hypothetical protein
MTNAKPNNRRAMIPSDVRDPHKKDVRKPTAMTETGRKAVDECDVTTGANECPLTGLKAATVLLGSDALSAPHNAQISGVVKVARLLRQQMA